MRTWFTTFLLTLLLTVNYLRKVHLLYYLYPFSSVFNAAQNCFLPKGTEHHQGIHRLDLLQLKSACAILIIVIFQNRFVYVSGYFKKYIVGY